MNYLLEIGGYAINVSNIRYMYPNSGNNRVNIVYGDGLTITVNGSLEEVTTAVNTFVTDVKK